MSWVIGVDVGGTFTDFFAIDQATGRTQVHKAPSTPDNPARAIVQGVLALCRQAGIDPREIERLEHGTTVGTNALIQRRGAPVALITTAGFRDLLEIGRQTRPHMFDLQRDQPAPLVPRHLRFEIDERLLADGSVHRALTPKAAERAVRAVLDSGVEACAVCLLFSFIDGRHERLVGETFARLAPGFAVSLSSEVQPEFREFERLSTTVLNAYLQPLVGRYLDELERSTAESAGSFPIGISQSSGGIMSIRRARNFPVRTALSGPAAGVMGAVSLARRSEQPQAITLDMGGTSTDVCLIRDYAASIASGRSVADFPIKLPMVDIETIGAGGGSIAWFERDGLLKVGPISAGAVPGPACYGAGGREPTVTDANLVLGRLSGDGLIGGGMPLDVAAARAALLPGAERLGYSLEQMAHGIVSIVNSNMVRALRTVSVERGFDPRGLTLVPFGGAGPLHATEVARSIGIGNILVPFRPGILCAQGLVDSPLREEFVLTHRTPLAPGQEPIIAAKLEELRLQAQAWFADEELPKERQLLEAALDMRYVGQNFEITVLLEADDAALPAAPELLQRFFAAHERSYGFSSKDDPVEIVNYRLSAIAQLKSLPSVAEAAAETSPATPRGSRPVYFDAERPVLAAIYDRAGLRPGQSMTGPAVIDQFDSTTLLFPGDNLRVDAHLNLLIQTEP